VEPRRSDHGVKVIGPRPGRCAAGQWNRAFPNAIVV
jgi:hypothetical protein